MHRTVKNAAAAVVTALLSLLLAVSAFADILKPADGLYVNDDAGVLSEDVKAEIAEKSSVICEQSGCQIAVVTVRFLGGMEISDYAERLFTEWKLGSGRDNGILLLFATGEENYYVLTGSGLSESLSPSWLDKTLKRYTEPDFAAGDYSAAAQKTYSAIASQVEGIYSITSDRALYEQQKLEEARARQQKAQERLKLFAAAAVFALLAFLFIMRFAFSLKARRRRARARRITAEEAVPREIYREPVRARFRESGRKNKMH